MKWVTDSAHSKVTFSVKKFWGMVTVVGSFNSFEGQVETPDSSFSSGSVQLKLNSASLTSGNARRDGHLQTADFFDSTVYPQVTFNSTRVEQLSQDEYRVEGNLTIKTTTRPVTLQVKRTAPTDQTQAVFQVTTTLDRHDFGLNFNKIPLAKEAVINIELALVPAEVSAQARV